MIRIITDHGSVYKLDCKKLWWCRTHKTSYSGQLRQYQGKFNSFRAVLGQPLVIRCPNQVLRCPEETVINTSPVIRIVYGPDRSTRSRYD